MAYRTKNSLKGERKLGMKAMQDMVKGINYDAQATLALAQKNRDAFEKLDDLDDVTFVACMKDMREKHPDIYPVFWWWRNAEEKAGRRQEDDCDTSGEIRYRAFMITQFLAEPFSEAWEDDRQNLKSGVVPWVTEEQILDGLDHKSIKRWAWIWHNRDVYTEEDEIADSTGRIKAGDPKFSHVHIMVDIPTKATLSSVSRWFKIPPNMIEIMRGRGAFLDGVEYIVHESPKAVEQFKTHYDDAEMHASPGFDFRKELTDLQAHRAKYGTGKLFCGYCGESMQGVSGTSKTGAKHYYYYCSGQRKHACDKKPVKKDTVENAVLDVLYGILANSENTFRLADNALAYYNEHHKDTGYLESLEAELKDTQKALDNLVKALEMGIFSESTQQRLTELENRKKSLECAIENEYNLSKLFQDEHTIMTYFQRYSNPDNFDDEMRDEVLEYFIDKIYVYDDRIIVTGPYFDGIAEQVSFDELTDDSIEFDSFVFSSTIFENPAISMIAGFFVVFQFLFSIGSPHFQLQRITQNADRKAPVFLAPEIRM